MPEESTIRVKGLRDLQRGLNQLEQKAGPELRKELNEVAEIVLASARVRVPRRTGAAAGSMKVGSTQRAAQIKVGGSKAPYYPWLDFGGSVGRGHRPGVAGSGSVKRPLVDGGRYVYPALREKRPEVVRRVDELIERLAASAGFDTTGKING